MESWLCTDWSRNFFLPKKNLMQRILHCHHENTPLWKFFIAMSPIRCKNHLMQLKFFIFYYSSGKTCNTFIHVSFFAAVCTALYHCVPFFFVRALMFLSSLRPWIFWVICWAGLEVNKAILVECLSCTIQYYLNQKWWCKGLRVARPALKTVHSGQFDNPPPQKKKYTYIYNYIYILQHPPALSQ